MIQEKKIREVAAEILWQFFVPFNLNMLYLFQLFFIFRICMAFHQYFQTVQAFYYPYW